MKTKLVLVGAVLVLLGCDDGDPGAAMMPAPDAGSGGAAIGTGGTAGEGTGGTAGAGFGGAAGTPSSSSGGSGGATGAGTGGAIGTGGVVGSGGTAGVQGTGGGAGTGGTGGAPQYPMCAATIRNSGPCEVSGQVQLKKKNGFDCFINCSSIVGGTGNIGPPSQPTCVSGSKICVASCGECS